MLYVTNIGHTVLSEYSKANIFYKSVLEILHVDLNFKFLTLSYCTGCIKKNKSHF